MDRNSKIITIKEFTNMDIFITTPNENGVFMDRINIRIPTPTTMLLLVKVARGENGYYFGLSYETQTGGSLFAPSLRERVYKNKEASFIAAIEYVKRHPQSFEMIHPKYLSDAVQELFDAKQLELF